MSEEDKKPERRSEPRVWLYTEHWLWGSTRSELTLEERAVFIDLLCLGITGQGKVDITHRDQVAGQLLVPLDIFNSCIDKGIKNGKFIIKNFKRYLADFKTYLIILNWKRYQPEYLHDRPLKSTKKTRSDKGGKHDAHVALLEDRRGGNIKEEDRIGEEEVEEEGEKNALPPIPKYLDFKIQDQLRQIRADYREALRLQEDPDPRKRQYMGLSEKELAHKIEGLKKSYLDMLEDYK